ncbi:potassium channel protein [Nitrosopumilus cobalaminigenes]|uniref:Potassium channel protein n=1 Tax=Nitrosopumilus cobalaminigenes TaxID=1470066 RepID=A0A7D5M1A2_9ARCH|nr:ion transporter [Nitrosopumilus cobalaminigenes]QLH03355.1 potassium channel protein [Nitrosopumilus cobalaminigenes]
MTNKVMQRTYEILEGTTNDKITKAFQFFIIGLITVNVIVVIIETEESVLDEYGYLFTPFEVFSIIIFTGEYIGRIIVCKLNPKYNNSKFGILRFIFTPMMLVDLAAILPFFLPFVVTDTRFIRIIRLLRLFRLFKLARYSDPMQTLGQVFKSKAGDLAVAFFILFIVLIFASSLMYHAEHEAQPEVFSSIPASMWWGIVTLTTIGYGDVYPITIPGKLIAAGVAVIGIAVYAIPTGIMASAFTEELRKKKAKTNNTCPHCGKDISHE